MNGSAITKLYFTNETTFYDSNHDFVGLENLLHNSLIMIVTEI